MSTARAPAILLALALLAGALATARLAAAGVPVGAEIGRARVQSLEPELRARVEEAGEGLLLQWFATPGARLPTGYGAVEDAVQTLFAALRAAAPGRVVTQVLHPEDDPEVAAHAAALGLSSFRARHVERDAWTEREVWSALRIVRGGRGAAVVRGLTPALASDLQPLVAAHLRELARPRRPIVALSAPPGHRQLRRLLEGLADVREIDFEARPALPPDCDLFLWIASSDGTAQRAELARLLARGGSAVVAASRWTAAAEGGALRFSQTGAALDALLEEHGLRAASEPVLEAPPPAARGTAGWSFARVRSIGSQQDFRVLGPQPNGTLVFDAPAPLEPLPERLRQIGGSFHALASSSERCFALPAGVRSASLADLAAGSIGRALPAQALLALVRPLEPTRGSLAVLASAALLSDGLLGEDGLAHRELVRTLVRGLASSERRALAAVARAAPEPLRPLSRGERWTARALCIALAPVLLLAAGIWRGAFVLSTRGGRAFLLPAAGLVSLAAIGALSTALGAGAAIDLSRAQSNRPAPELLEVVAAAARRGRLTIETAFSARLPPELRPLVEDARARLAALARDEDGVDVRDVAPDALAEADLRARGLRALRGTSLVDEELTSREFFAAIRLQCGDSATVLELPDPAAFDHLDFRVAVALRTLATGRPPVLALASEAVRITPAEAHALYQQRGLFAPSSGDPFAAARALLVAHGFQVVALDPAQGRIPDGIDALVWFQPRRDASALTAALARHLRCGGRALVAVQMHRVRPRLRAVEPDLWPEPLFPDVDRLWLPHVGLELAPELVLDAQHGTLAVEGTAERDGSVEAARLTLASPVIVRSTPAGRPASAITAGIGDLLLLSPAAIRLDAARLAAHGLAARPLLTTSDRSWTWAWTGGRLPRSALESPVPSSPPAVLAALVEGTFPGADADPELPPAADERAAGRGTLMLLGASDLFTDAQLTREGCDHARFLLQASAALTLPDEYPRILARRPATGGFRLLTPAERGGARAFAWLAGPLAVLVGGLAWRTRRERRWTRAEVRA